jgi:hypothetical protein
MVEALCLLPVYFRKIVKKLASELCSIYSSQYCKLGFKLIKLHLQIFELKKTRLLFLIKFIGIRLLYLYCVTVIGMSINKNCFVYIQVMQRKRREDGH